LKNSLRQGKVIDAASMAASITSAPTQIAFLDNIYYQVEWSGTSPVGSMSVEVSSSYDQRLGTGSWDAVVLPVTPSIAANTGSISIDLNQLGAPWVRLVYTRTSGTGTMTAYISAKSV